MKYLNLLKVNLAFCGNFRSLCRFLNQWCFSTFSCFPLEAILYKQNFLSLNSHYLSHLSKVKEILLQFISSETMEAELLEWGQSRAIFLRPAIANRFEL